MIPLYLFVLLPIFSAVVTYIMNHRKQMFIVFAVQTAMILLAAWNFMQVRFHGFVLQVLGGYPLNIGIALKADLFSSLMVLLTVFLFSAMLLYNYHKSYMNRLFLFLFLLLQGLMSGLFLSNDLFNIYVMIETSTILVTILIVFKKDSQSIYDGMIYMLVNMASMTLFLLGLGYIYRIFGTMDLTLLAERIPQVQRPRDLIIPFALLITAIDLKAAIMPLFSWLPKAHGTASAPSIISALLSGLYVKSGVFLFMRILTLFQPVFDDYTIFVVLGFLTAFLGFIFALSQTNIKLILAYHTVSQVGLIVFGLTLNSTYSYWGAVYHIINHAIFKTTLFLTAGIIIESYGTRDIRRIHGVYKRMPVIAIASFMAILGITGAPLFNGAVSKYLIQKGSSNQIYDIGFLIINLGTIVSFVKYSTMFFGKENADLPRQPIRWNQSLVVLSLGLICLLGGVLGPVIMDGLFNFHISISMQTYAEKFILYLTNVGIGLAFYFLFYKRIGLFKQIRELELTYNQIIMTILIFYSGFLTYMYYRF